MDLSFRAKVGDFGLVRAIGDTTKSKIHQSQTARIVGTSGYIAPEYYRGVITTKLDTYAFGVVSNSNDAITAARFQKEHVKCSTIVYDLNFVWLTLLPCIL